MFIGLRKTLYDHITELLLVKPSTVLTIQENLTKRQVGASLQGIYKALRELMAEDIIVKQKKVYSVNNIWREKTASLFSKRERFRLSAGEQIMYRFKKLDHLDAFWKHTLADIEHEFKNFPEFHFTPHQFWSFVPGRKESEREYYLELKQQAIHAYTIIGGNTPIDHLAQKALRTDYHQAFLDPSINFNRRDHLSIIGDYVILTRISVSLAHAVDEAYATATDELQLEKKFDGLFKNPGSIVMIVENNQTKAMRLRKKMSADFHVPRELREKFNLF